MKETLFTKKPAQQSIREEKLAILAASSTVIIIDQSSLFLLYSTQLEIMSCCYNTEIL